MAEAINKEVLNKTQPKSKVTLYSYKIEKGCVVPNPGESKKGGTWKMTFGDDTKLW